jgi:hypothetical protein
MTHRHLRGIAIALAVTAALAAPAAAQDLRSPDAADAGGKPAVASIDLRSPDAVDPYAGVPARVIERAPVASIREVDPGFDWGDASVGAGALLTLVLLVMGGAVLRKRHGPTLG